MQQSGPITYAYAAADGYVWAKYIFWEVPSMQQGGPIAYAYAAADRYRCSRVGQLHMSIQLLIATPRHLNLLRSITDAMGQAHWNAWLQLLIAMPGLIIFLVSAPDATGWAHHSCICSCQWLHLGWLYFWEVPPVQYGGPIAYTYAAADGNVWAH